MADSQKLKEPSSSSLRGAETVSRALDVVTEMLESGGEGSVRVAEVSKRSGVSTGSLYHHFESRTGLIAAARERQFARDRTYPGQVDAAGYLAATTPAEFVRLFDEMLTGSETPVAAAGRHHRFEMIGAAAARPQDFPGVVELEVDFLDLGEAIGTALHQRGWLKVGIEPRSVALFLHTLSMARVVRELDDSVSPEAWRTIVREALSGIFVTDEHLNTAT
jgi:AcrR family transcriptional regulator